MNLNIWINKKTALFIGGNPTKGQVPVITTDVSNPQLLIDTDKGTIVIIETTSKPEQPTKK